MSRVEGKPKFRPFHETVVELMGKASPLEALALVDLIKMTAVPKNHEAILAALREMGECCGVITEEAEVAVLEQQRETKREGVGGFFSSNPYAG